jgi:hypothetical protein
VRPRASLLIQDDRYLREIQNLVTELRTLNSLLANLRTPPKKTSQAAGKLAKHFDVFLNSYAKSLGHGAGYLTIAVIGSILYQFGIGHDMLASVTRKLPH